MKQNSDETATSSQNDSRCAGGQIGEKEKEKDVSRGTTGQKKKVKSKECREGYKHTRDKDHMSMKAKTGKPKNMSLPPLEEQKKDKPDLQNSCQGSHRPLRSQKTKKL